MGSYRLTWWDFGSGKLALGHRPGKKLRKALQAEGCTLVVSLLSASESTASVGPHRVRLPLDGADPPDPGRDGEVAALFSRVQAELSGGGRVFVHCSAGLHRTGMIAYAFLRHAGLSEAEAIAGITAMRALTAAELTGERKAWGERYAAGTPSR